MAMVVTYESPDSRDQVALCGECEAELRGQGAWTHDWQGREHCQVRRGAHGGACGRCRTRRGERVVADDETLNVW